MPVSYYVSPLFTFSFPLFLPLFALSYGFSYRSVRIRLLLGRRWVHLTAVDLFFTRRCTFVCSQLHPGSLKSMQIGVFMVFLSGDHILAFSLTWIRSRHCAWWQHCTVVVFMASPIFWCLLKEQRLPAPWSNSPPLSHILCSLLPILFLRIDSSWFLQLPYMFTRPFRSNPIQSGYKKFTVERP